MGITLDAKSPRARRIALMALLSIAALLAVFGIVADEVLEGDSVTFDRAITSLFRVNGDMTIPVGPPWLQEAVRDVTSLGSISILSLILIASVMYLVLARQVWEATFLAVSAVGGTIVSSVLKAVFNRPRPDVEASLHVFSASFPSGHATMSAVVYLTLGVLLAGSAPTFRQGAFFVGLGVFLTLIVGISRVYLGMHYPTDVLAGWSLGGSWAILCLAARATLWHVTPLPREASRD